jgi:hypothetical protein
VAAVAVVAAAAGKDHGKPLHKQPAQIFVFSITVKLAARSVAHLDTTWFSQGI